MADRPNIEIHVPDELRHGVYANFLVVSHGPHEFTLDFCQLSPSQTEGTLRAEVVARVRIAPTLVGRVIAALNTNMTAYEERYGSIPVVG